MNVSLALRRFLREPFSSLAIVSIFGVGIGALTAALSAGSHFFFQPLAVDEPERLFRVFELGPDGSRTGVSLQSLEDWLAARPTRMGDIEDFAAYSLRSFGVRGPESHELAIVQVGMVTGRFFPVLGAQPSLGRGFSRREVLDSERLIVLTEATRRRLFDEQASVLGQRIELNESEYSVIGVLPESFDFPIQVGRSQTLGGGRIPDAFIPLSYPDYSGRRQIRTLGAIARLAERGELHAAIQELQLVAKSLAQDHPETSRGFSAELVPIKEAIYGSNRRPIVFMLMGVSVLLIIVLANVESLMLGRWVHRVTALAVHQALGARRIDLFYQVLTETLFHCGLGYLFALWVATELLATVKWFFPLLGGFAPERLSLDWSTLSLGAGSTLVLALGLSIGVVTIGRLTDAKGFFIVSSAHRVHASRAHAWTIAIQVALSAVLFLVTGVMVKSLGAILNEERGYTSENVLVFGIGLPEQRYDSGEKLIEFHQRLSASLAELGGVESAGLSGLSAPLGRISRQSFELEDYPLEPIQRPRAVMSVVGPDYFEALSIPLLAGRKSSWDDRPETPRVVHVSEGFLERYLNNEWRGRRLRLAWFDDLTISGSLWEVIGVVGDVRAASLERSPEPTIYLSASQVPANGGRYFLKTNREDPDAIVSIRNAKSKLDPDIQEVHPYRMEDLVNQSVADRRFASMTATSLTLLALFLCSAGIFGSVSSRIAAQSRNLGIRFALGETETGVKQRVIGNCLSLVGRGLAAGLVAYVPLSKLVSSYAYGVSSIDARTTAVMAGTLLIVGWLAAWLAVRRLSSATLGTILRNP